MVAAVSAARGATAIFEAHYVTSIRSGTIVDQRGAPAVGMGVAYLAMGFALLAVALYQYDRFRRLALVIGAVFVAAALAGFAFRLST
jgi:hypothetical protein